MKEELKYCVNSSVYKGELLDLINSGKTFAESVYTLKGNVYSNKTLELVATDVYFELKSKCMEWLHDMRARDLTVSSIVRSGTNVGFPKDILCGCICVVFGEERV